MVIFHRLDARTEQKMKSNHNQPFSFRQEKEGGGVCMYEKNVKRSTIIIDYDNFAYEEVYKASCVGKMDCQCDT